MEQLMTFKMNPIQFIIAKISSKYNLPNEIYKNIYKYINNQQIDHIQINIFNNQMFLCYRYKKMHNMSNSCIICDKLHSKICNICNEKHYDNMCDTNNCNVCKKCHYSSDHKKCTICNISLCDPKHKKCKCCYKCESIKKHKYCYDCKSCVTDEHITCDLCNTCYSSESYAFVCSCYYIGRW